MGIRVHFDNNPAEILQISSEHPLGDRIRVPYTNKDDQPCVFVPLLVQEPVQPSLSANVRRLQVYNVDVSLCAADSTGTPPPKLTEQQLHVSQAY